MIEVNCVIWGNKFSEDYVHILKASIERNTSVEYKFVCYSDREIQGINTRKLPGGLNGWWNKLFLFNKDLREQQSQVIYFDLDTMITGNIDWLMNYDGNFAILDKGLIDTDFNETGYFASGLIVFNSEMNHYIWEIFLKENEFGRLGFEGDQDFLTFKVNRNLGADCIQKMGRVCSYKFGGIYDLENSSDIPEDLSIVCFHGVPMPHQAITEDIKAHGRMYLKRSWVGDYWKL